MVTEPVLIPESRFQQGFALLTSMLFMAMLAVFSVGMIYIVQTEARQAGTEMVNVEAYYGASAAMDKMVVDLNDLYATQTEPSVTSITALGGASYEPSFTTVSFSTYSFTVPNTSGAMDFEVRTVESGPNEGLMADINTMTLDVVASASGGEAVTMTRDVQLAQIPVFQFGVFSDADLSYFSTDTFDMEGRVHTNGNLFLASGDSTTGLVFHSRITAVGEVIRQELANGESTSSLTDPVLIPTAPNGCQGSRPACRDLAETEGSKATGPSSNDNASWTNLSETTYSGMILNADTGAKALDLPFVNSGVRPVELIRRPPSGESATSLLGESRLYNMAQIRIFISDTAAENPGGAGKRLANVFPYYFLGVYGATNTPFAETGGAASEIDGYLLVQGRQSDSSYADVTMEWLNLGISRGLNADAILKFEYEHEHYPPDGVANHPGDKTPDRLDMLNLYDTREGEERDNVADTECALGGIMNVVDLDVGNLKRWLEGTIGATGTNVESTSQDGYLLYFSDRRGMQPDPAESNVLMGEYGFEDVINASSTPGVPDDNLDPSEDVDGSGALDTYGETNLGDGFSATDEHFFRIDCEKAWELRVSGARRVLKLVNGALGSVPLPGFTVGSENPVYVHGNYNANGSGFGDPHSSAAIIADSVTLLSNNWADWTSVGDDDPTNLSNRPASTTWYRMAVVAGKSIGFDNPTWSSNDNDGLDGGVLNLMRSLEDWALGTDVLHYKALW